MSRRDAGAVTLAALGYVVLTIAYTWPLALHVPHGIAHDPGDPVLNAWILWWTTQAVPLTPHWWNAPIFFPATGVFAFSEHLLGLAPLAAPIIALTRNATFGYNVALLASFVLNALGMYLLAFTLARRHDAAFVAGLAYAFAPYRMAQLPHIQVLSSYWAPACLAALHRYDRSPRGGWAVLGAAAWLMQSLANGYFMFFLSVLLACWFMWFAVGRWTLRQWITVGACFAAAALALAPVIAGYRRILLDTYGFTRGLAVIQEFSADVASLLHASDESWLWGWVHVVRKPEAELLPGLTIVLLVLYAVVAARPFSAAPGMRRTGRVHRTIGALFVAIAGVAIAAMFRGPWRLSIGGVRILSVARFDKPLTLALIAAAAWVTTAPRVLAAARRRSPLLFYGFAAVTMWTFALGPDPGFLGHRFLYQAPYGWLMRLPGFDGLRVPARFWTMSLVCLGVLAALAVNRLGGATRRVVVALAAVGLVLDGWPREFNVLPEPEHRPVPAGVAARLVLPMTDDQDALALYQQTLDGVPLYNGYSGYVAPHQYAMRELFIAHDPRILRALAARGALAAVVGHDGDPDGRYRKFVSSYPGAALVETHPAWSSYVIPAAGERDLLPDRHGDSVAIASLDAFPSAPHAPRAADNDLKTRWSGGVQRAAADFTIDLGRPQRVGQVVTSLGEFWTDFPRRLLISVSPDGTQWTGVFDGDTALHAYYAAMRHPKEVPLVFPIARDNVRFVRLQQLGWSAHDWSIAEVQVLR